MEIKTCEEYVLNKLTETEEELYKAQETNGELQRVLYTVQGCLELQEAEDGSLSVSIDAYVLEDQGLVDFLKQYLGRGKFTATTEDKEENIDLEGFEG